MMSNTTKHKKDKLNNFENYEFNLNGVKGS